MISVCGVTHFFSSSREPARAGLRELNWEIARGDWVALIGPNGSGKSTLLKIVAGLVRPTDGHVLCQGERILDLSAGQRAGRVVYVGADLRVDFPLKAIDAVMLGAIAQETGGLLTYASAQELERARTAMERCHCWALRYRDVRSLSDGERQLVNLARALMQGARVLLLDEALSRMDLHHQAQTGELLQRLTRDEGYAVVLVAHDLNLATEWANRCVLMQSGQIVAQGALADTLTEKHLHTLYPEVPLLLSAHPTTGVPKVFIGR